MPVPKSPDEALEWIRSYEGFYGKRTKQFEIDEKYYEGDLEDIVALPEGYDVIIPTTGRAVVDEAVDNTVPADIGIDYRPRGQSPKALKDADLVREFLRGVVHHWRTQGMDIDFVRDFLKNIYAHGMGVVKVVPDWTLWPTLDEETEAKLMAEDATGGKRKQRVDAIKHLRKAHFPLVIRSLAPQCILEDATVGSRKLWMIERYECGIEEVLNIYEPYAGPDNPISVPNVNGRYKVYEVWTATHATPSGDIVHGRHWIFLNNQLINSGEDDDLNPYHDLPYGLRFSGFGRETFRGEPQYKSVGFFTRQVRSNLDAQIRRHSQFEAIMSQLAFPIAVLPDDVEDGGFDVAPGAVNYLPTEAIAQSDKFFLRAPIPDAEYLNSLKLIEAQIERGTTQVPLRGAPVPGTDSAAQLSTYVGQSKLRLDGGAQALTGILEWALSRVLWYVENILQDDTSVTITDRGEVSTLTLGPKNIQGHYAVGVRLMPNEEQVKERKLALASDAIVKGGFSRYDALTWAGFDNASEIIANRDADDVMQEPLIKRAIAKKMLEQWGIDAEALALEEQMEQAEGQAILQSFMAALQSQMMQGQGAQPPPGGDPNTPVPGMIPPGQDPTAALAQQGAGPMPLPPGPPVMDPAIAPPQQMQQPMV